MRPSAASAPTCSALRGGRCGGCGCAGRDVVSGAMSPHSGQLSTTVGTGSPAAPELSPLLSTPGDNHTAVIPRASRVAGSSRPLAQPAGVPHPSLPPQGSPGVLNHPSRLGAPRLPPQLPGSRFLHLTPARVLALPRPPCSSWPSPASPSSAPPRSRPGRAHPTPAIEVSKSVGHTPVQRLKCAPRSECPWSAAPCPSRPGPPRPSYSRAGSPPLSRVPLLRASPLARGRPPTSLHLAHP